MILSEINTTETLKGFNLCMVVLSLFRFKIKSKSGYFLNFHFHKIKAFLLLFCNSPLFRSVLVFKQK